MIQRYIIVRSKDSNSRSLPCLFCILHRYQYKTHSSLKCFIQVAFEFFPHTVTATVKPSPHQFSKNVFAYVPTTGKQKHSSNPHSEIPYETATFEQSTLPYSLEYSHIRAIDTPIFLRKQPHSSNPHTDIPQETATPEQSPLLYS